MELDETKETQDESSESTETTSGENEETFTKGQLEEAGRKGKSDALAEVGRLKKATENAIKAAQAAETRVDQMIKDQEDAELKSAAGDEERMSAIKERSLRRKAESDLTQLKSELDTKNEELDTANAEKAENTKERNARDAASRLGVDSKMLVKLAKFTDGSTEAIEDVAKELPKKDGGKSLKVDSGKTTGGGGGIPTDATKFRTWVGNLSQKEYEQLRPEIEKMREEGKIK